MCCTSDSLREIAENRLVLVQRASNSPRKRLWEWCMGQNAGFANIYVAYVSLELQMEGYGEKLLVKNRPLGLDAFAGKLV